ncbi:MAG: FlgO family outer membrane protein [candidate division WOR-3 bacterium]
MSKRHFIRLFFICILSAIFSISISQSSLAYEKEIKSLSLSLAENITKAGKKMIAVVDFTDLQGNITELGRFLAEEFSVSLAGTGKGFEVVDRTHLKSIIAEHKLSSTGIIDPQTARKLGQIAGVDALITGTITPFGDSVRISVKILDTGTAKVIGALSGDIAKTKAIEELLARGIETGVSATAVTTAPHVPKPQLKAQQKVEVKNFVFELQQCKISGGSVTCSMLITNKGADRELNLYGLIEFYGKFSRMFDDGGNQYFAQNVQLGNLQGKSAKLLLVAGIPTKAILTFEGVSKEANSISLLEVGCAHREDFTVQFRNIPLSR